MLVERVVVGALEVNCYIVFDEKGGKAVVVDPGDEPDRIMAVIKQNNLTVQYIVLTHAHFDHVGAVPEIKEETKARFAIHRDDAGVLRTIKDQGAMWGYKVHPLPEPDMLLKDEETIKAGGLAFDVLHTPGHSPGGMCLYGEETLFTGDTLFKGSVGRTDFPGGDINKLRDSFRRLMELPDDTRVFPGHMGETTIGRERKENFFSEQFLNN